MVLFCHHFYSTFLGASLAATSGLASSFGSSLACSWAAVIKDFSWASNFSFLMASSFSTLMPYFCWKLIKSSSRDSFVGLASFALPPSCFPPLRGPFPILRSLLRSSPPRRSSLRSPPLLSLRSSLNLLLRILSDLKIS